VEILKRLREAVRRKRPELWPKDCIFQYEKQFMARKSITEMGHTSFSTDLATDDFWLFPKIKSALEEQSIQDIEDIQKKSDDSTESCSQHKFQKLLYQWYHHWAKCTAAQGEYFEGNSSQ
jgi:hypothetical protein